MENIRTNVEQHFKAIQALLQEEKQYWKEIHSAIDQYVQLFYSTRHSTIIFSSEI